MRRIIVFIVCFLIFFTLVSKTLGDELDDVSHELDKLKRELYESQQASKPLEQNLNKLESELAAIRVKITSIETAVAKKQQELRIGEKALVLQKRVLDERIFSHYKNIKKSESSFLNILSSGNFTGSLQKFFYQKKLADRDKHTVIKIILYVKSLEEKKASLETEKSRLSVVKTEVDKQSQLLSIDVGNARKHQSELSGKIAQLSSKQQQLIGQKLAGLNIPRSAGTSAKGCIDDRSIDPGFSPRIAFFTYGVPNRTGLNQYGAKGRAASGQNEEQILRAYYDNFELKKDYDSGININVDGFGSFNIEDYVKRIYEMPGDWPLSALKAQAIAARSYALAYTNNGAGSICTTQQCQVFKPEPKGGAWEQAVNETRGWVMVQGGSPVKAWYSSTHGGYVLKSSEIGWSDTSWTKHTTDTTTGSAGGFGELQSNAYDKDSPWFYCDWGARASYNKTAWLKSEELADIVNVILLAKQMTDVKDKEHLYQTDKSNPAGTDTWNSEKVKSELRGRGGNPFSSVSDVTISADFGAGRTTNVTISGDAGSASFDGSEFKNWFNLRSPANIQIVGPLFNVEKR